MLEAIGEILLFPFRILWAALVLFAQLVVILMWVLVAVVVGVGFYYGGFSGAVYAMDGLVALLAIALVAYGESVGLAAAIALSSVAALFTFLLI